MKFLPDLLESYVEAHTTPETEVEQKLNRETHAKVMLPQMLSGHLQGKVLELFSLLVKPQFALEIGTYTGYSALSLAKGIRPGGKLITIDINEELEDMARKYWKDAGVNERIDYRIGDALEIIPDLDAKFDLVFIDADKVNYSNYYDLIFDKVRKDGIIIADNVLWSGKVVEPEPDKDTRALIAFNDKIHQDERVENILLPIRDGLMIIRKLR
ncbi:MAG: class I SAM-dependent methyltransferase [Bacteroidia bacterium]